MTAAIPRTSTPAILSLVFGILCWVALPLVGAVAAVVCGHLARSEIRRAPPGTLEGDGLAVAGLVMGWLHIALCIAFVAALFLFLGGLAWFVHAAPG